MSQASRSLKNLEAPRPLKSIGGARQTHHATPKYELQTSKMNFVTISILHVNFICFSLSLSVEELITLIENVADSVSMGQCNPDSMSLLLSCLRTHGPQLEEYSKSTLDQGTYSFTIPPYHSRPEVLTCSFKYFSFSQRM